jgi:methylase of polypeptide subunit release factors
MGGGHRQALGAATDLTEPDAPFVVDSERLPPPPLFSFRSPKDRFDMPVTLEHSTGMHDVVEQADGKRRAAQQEQQYSLARRALRRFIHFFSYHLILRQPWTRTSHAAGFKLRVPPTVFHPRFFITSEFFAGFIGKHDLTGKRVVEVGTGSGVIALAAARAGAERVLAVDINPAAARAAAANAALNGLGDRVAGLCSNLLSGVAPRPLFDVIISSPPSFAGEPRDVADRAWHAGPGYRDIAALFEQARERLAPGGVFYLLLSSDSDLELLGTLIERAGFFAKLVEQRSILIESFVLYELRTK